jgi:hypothetical protein
VLAVVQQEERRTLADRFGQRSQVACGSGGTDRQRRGDRAGNLAGSRQRGELSQPHAVWLDVDSIRGGVQGQAGLATAARAGQRHQTVLGQQAGHLGQRIAAADEARQLYRQVVAARLQGTQRRE